MKKTIGISFISLLFLFTSVIHAHPHDVGVIRGRISNNEGKPISGVKVNVLDAGIDTTTDKRGFFVLNDLPLGKHRVMLSHPEYMPGILEINVREKANPLVESSLSPLNRTLLIIRKEITVTAESDSLIDVNLPSHRNILTEKALDELGSVNIADSVRAVPGVDMVGKGGHSMSPAIRGLAENRILLLLDGARISSARRIGANASFVSLNDIDRIEVSRGPYSVYYGSGAIGGVIHMFTRNPLPESPLGGEIQMGYSSSHEERSGSINLDGSKGKFGYLLSASGKKAGEYKSPLGTVLDSDYSDYNLFAKINHTGERARFQLTFLDYYGRDIGKPSPTSLYKPRWYPKERNTVFSFRGDCSGSFGLDSLNCNAYLLLPALETEKENLRNDFSLEKRNLSRIESSDFGIKLLAGKKIDRHQFLNFGIDYFGRRNINDINSEWGFDSRGNITSALSEASLVDASLDNLGVFIDDNIHVGSSLTLKAGARFDFISTNNTAATTGKRTRKDSSLNAYVGTILQMNSRMSLIVDIGRSFRFPSLSELYYSGLTGRGTIFGNPDLEPENGLNVDLGLRYLHPHFFGSIYLFYNRIRNMIQKYAGPGDEEFHYRNLNRGRIRGIEGDFYFWPADDFEFKTNFHLLKGHDPISGTILNYIPPPRITFSGRWAPGRFWIEPRFTLSAKVADPGPLETEIDGYFLTELAAGFELNSHLRVVCIGQNLGNTVYRYSADVSGVEAPGRGVTIRIHYRF